MAWMDMISMKYPYEFVDKVKCSALTGYREVIVALQHNKLSETDMVVNNTFCKSSTNKE